MEKALSAKEIYTPFEKIKNGIIRISDRKITQIMDHAKANSLPTSIERIKAEDYLAVPGFVEVHVNGAGGADVMEGSVEKLRQIAQTLARFGTTSFLPTLITAPEDHILRVLTSLSEGLEEMDDGAIPLGFHLEGPFLNPAKRGTHPAEHLCLPNLKFLEKAFKASQGKLKILTLAPELPGALDLIREALGQRIIIALGHSNATYEETRKAIEAGATHAVHIFNGMRSLHQREPGILGTLLADDRVTTEIITDGVHVHPVIVNLLARSKPLDKIVLSTDGTAATAMPDGKYSLGARHFTVTNGVCLDEEGHLAGSSLTQDRGLRNFLSWTGLSLKEALRTVTVNPAQVLGLKNKGIIAPGADADLVLLDSNLEVKKTIVGGNIVYPRNSPIAS